MTELGAGAAGLPRATALRVWVFTLLTGLLGVVVAQAQTNAGEIRGFVSDQLGAALPGATVTARHIDTGYTSTRLTDATGRYYIPGLPIGHWNISAELRGFTSRTEQHVLLELGRTLEVGFVLGVGALTSQITVTTEAPLIQTGTAEISDIIGSGQMLPLPLNNRNFMSLAQLSDGVVIPPGGTRGEALQQAGPLPNVGGQRSGHNIYLLDGAKVTDELFNNLVISPSVDSIQEFKIQKSLYPAEFEGKASALINVATKAGSNSLRGSLFEFARDDRFDARNYFDRRDRPVPPLSQHQFGATLGGPLLRNRTFFFVSGEGQRTRRSLTRTFSVPSLTARSGNLAGFAPVCDPMAPGSPSGGCGLFPNNTIPVERLDPIAVALLERVPAPTSDTWVQNLTAVERQIRDSAQMSGRVDHRLDGGSQLFTRFSSFDADEVQPFGTNALQETLMPGFGRTLKTKTRNLAVSHTQILGQSWLNELRVAWMGVKGGQASLNRGVDFASQVGLLGVTRDSRDVGFPQINTRGLFSAIGDPTTFTYRDNTHVEVYDNVTLDRGAHRIKFGGYLFHLTMRPEQADNARGAFTFTGQFTGNAFADLLLGYPTSATSGIGRGDEVGRTNWVHAYLQDDWRLRDNLTVNVGLRYELNQHMYDLNNRLSSIDLSVPGGQFVLASDDSGRLNSDASALLPLIPIPYTTSAALGWGRGLLDPSAVRLAPRTGVAWTLDDARTVIRGGYGVFLNQWAYSVQTAFARNLPYFYTRQVDVPSTQTVPTLQTRDILASGATGLVGANIMDYDYNVEYTQTWSGGVQHEMTPASMVELLYMGSWTVGADNPTVRNVPEPGPGSIQARRPIPSLGRINAIRFDGKSIYHALTVKAQRRLHRGFAYNVHYTLSRSVDDASSPGATESESNVPQNVRAIFDGEWAPSSFDHRHQAIASATLQVLPSLRGPGWRPALFGAWQVTGILTALSGAPFTVNLGVDRANIGAGPAQRPDQLHDPNLPVSDRTPEHWFDTDAFALQAPFTFGSAPRNSVVGPGIATLDLAVARTWTLARGTNLEVRWEVFNALNRANLDLPNRIFGSQNFGRVFSAKNPREMQFGARVSF